MSDPRVEVLPPPHFPPAGSPYSGTPVQRGNRKRWILFTVVFALGCAGGLSWTFLRPAVYRSTATLRLVPPVAPATGAAQATTGTVEGQVQVLTSRPLLEKLLQRLPPDAPIPQDGAADRLAAAREMLSVDAEPDAGLVYLRAQGNAREFLPVLVNAWVDTYLQAQLETSRTDAAATDTDLRKRLAELGAAISAKRAELSAFQRQHDIVSMHREENATLARLKGLTATLDKTTEDAISAESRLNALRDAVAAGKPVGRPQDLQSLAGLETHAEQLREQMKEYEQVYTPAYIAIDTRIQAVKKQLEMVDRKLQEKRKEVENRALTEAEQNLQSARQSVADVKQKLTDAKRKAATFSAAFARSQAIDDELTQLQTDANGVKEQLVQARLARQRSTPQVQVLERASSPTSPVWPRYDRDAALAVGGSLLFALLCVWLADYLGARPGADGGSAAPSVHYSLVQMESTSPVPGRGRLANGAAPPGPLSGPGHMPALAANAPMELSTSDVVRLLEAADPPTRTLAMMLLSGLDVEEASALTWNDIDPDAGVLHVPGSERRAVTLPLRLQNALRAAAPADAASGAQPLWRDPKGKALPVHDLEAAITCAAHDARISSAREIDARTLRHTYIAHLARQGLRLSELQGIVGYVPPGERLIYGTLSPPGDGISPHRAKLVYPVLEEPAVASG